MCVSMSVCTYLHLHMSVSAHVSISAFVCFHMYVSVCETDETCVFMCMEGGFVKYLFITKVPKF